MITSEDLKIYRRRIVIVRVDPDLIVGLFNLNAQALQGERVHVVCPTFPDLPEGYVVLGVDYDFPTDSFLIKILHPDFPERMEDDVYPTIDSEIRYVKLQQVD